MRVLIVLSLLCAVQPQHVQSQSKFWDYSQRFLSNFFRHGKNVAATGTTTESVTYISTTAPSTTPVRQTPEPSTKPTTTTLQPKETSTVFVSNKTLASQTTLTTIVTTTISSTSVSDLELGKNNFSTLTSTIAGLSTIESSTGSTIIDSTTPDFIATTGEPRENPNSHEFYLSTRKEKPLIKLAANISQNLLPLPAGASAALVKPTKYHYYPHNQHIYLLPECAIQQVSKMV